MMGDALAETLFAGLADKPTVSLRLNRKKRQRAPIGSKQVPWCPDGYWLAERPQFTLDPHFHAGHYYVQEAASMFIDTVLRQLVKSPVTMLDLCAAPGGKTTAALAALPAGSMLVANEPIRTRANILAENIIKWGSDRTVVTCEYPRELLRCRTRYDVILCDAPCSGEGMFRKDAGAIEDWSERKVADCADTQRDILDSAWRLLKPGGLLIYSTCTFNDVENELNVDYAIDRFGFEPVEIATNPDWGIIGWLGETQAKPVYRFIPGVTHTEGLFMAVLRRPGNGETTETLRKQRQSLQYMRDSLHIGEWLKGREGYSFRKSGDTIVAMPKDMQLTYNDLADNLNIVHAGITLARTKGATVLPDISLALSGKTNTDVLPEVGLIYEEALAYLRHESFTLPDDTPRGPVLVTYQKSPLGFMKNVGSRANNLYPAEWRIRKGE